MAIVVDSTWETVVMLLIAAVAGMLGGLLSELILARSKKAPLSTGRLELPSTDKPFYDLGSFSAVLVGLGAALIGFALLSPPEQAVVDQDIVSQYEPWRVIALGIVAGFAGPQFLILVRERFLKSVETGKKDELVSAILTETKKRKNSREDQKKKAKESAKQEGKEKVVPKVRAAAKATPRAQRETLGRIGRLEGSRLQLNVAEEGGQKVETVELAEAADPDQAASEVEEVLDEVVDDAVEKVAAGGDRHLDLIEALCEQALTIGESE